MIKAFSHINFGVNDLEKSIHFYCDILGFKKAFELCDEQGNVEVAYLMIQDSKFIELGHKNNPSVNAGSFKHVCFEVEDMEALIKLLEQHNIPLRTTPKKGRDQNIQCFVSDPDGNNIEFMQMHPDSPQQKARKELKF